MHELARQAGVHPATVSRALRDDRRISPAQRERIQRLAASLGYRKNPLVAALMSARRSPRRAAYRATLAVLTHYPADRASFFTAEFGELLRGARDRARSLGYHLEEFNVQDPALSPARLTGILRARDIHGLVVAPLHSIHDTVPLDWSQFAAVAIGYSLQQIPVTRVAHNHFNGVTTALRHARTAGFRRPGFLLPRRVHEKVARRWLAAFLLEQSEHAAPPVPPLLTDDLAPAEFSAWFRHHAPDVLLCIHVPLVQSWLARLGPRGTRVGVISLDRRPRDRGIAGIDQAYPRLGAAAIDTVVGMLHRNEVGLPATPLTLLLDGTWIDGRSLPPVSAPHPAPRSTPARAPAG